MWQTKLGFSHNGEQLSCLKNLDHDYYKKLRVRVFGVGPKLSNIVGGDDAHSCTHHLHLL